MMNLLTGFLILSVLTLLLEAVAPDRVPAGPPESASLTEVVFIGLRSPKELEQDLYPKERQACVQRYLDVIPPNSDLFLLEAPSSPEEAVPVRKRNLVEQMVVILGENARSEAKTFASAVPLLGEWEGMSEGPVDEADFAGQWLVKSPESPIAPFLHLFRAHRFRAGYEAARAGQQDRLWPILAERYGESLGKARSSIDPLISCIAADLEAQAYVYLEGQGGP
jgi:hypothetical protein